MVKKFQCAKLLPIFFGIVMVCFSAYLIQSQFHVDYIYNMLKEQFQLVEGNPGYEQIWFNVDLYFSVWLFDVLNPEDVIQGALPELRERGPYVYDMNIKKEIVSLNEEMDEIEFMTRKTFHFNPKLSVGSENDKVTVINSAYVSTMGMISAKFPSMLKSLGNEIPKLFPGETDIFVRAKVGDILFYGLRMECDPVKHKKLNLVCGALMKNKPEIIKDTNVPGVFETSFFDRWNGTLRGPLTINRGVKNQSLLGNTSSFKGVGVQKLWGSDDCNRVIGTDSITWAPMDTKLDYVLVYEPEICRSVKIVFEKEVIVNGLKGWRYKLNAESWEFENIKCYCPTKSKKIFCPVNGLMDLTSCQGGPIFYSEPHFLHGDPSLLEYARGLNPSEELHSTFVTIEPATGVPLSGSKKTQLSVQLLNMPTIEFLVNVTGGYFPLMWFAEGKNATIESLGGVLQAYRLLRLINYMIHVSLVIGIFLILKTIYLQLIPDYQIEYETIQRADSVIIQQNQWIDNSKMVHGIRARNNRT